MWTEWPTPGLCPGVVGRKASTYPSMLRLNWLGLATTPFSVLTVAMLIALTLEDFSEWSRTFLLKVLPSMQSSSHDTNNRTKSKQVRAKCAMLKDEIRKWRMKRRRGRKRVIDVWIACHYTSLVFHIYRPRKADACAPNTEGRVQRIKKWQKKQVKSQASRRFR